MSQDLQDHEFDELDQLLEQTPGGLDAMDVAMLDGYLCGVLVQPSLLPQERWLPHVFDSEGRPLPEDADPAWRTRTGELIERRLAALRRQLAEDQWFDPIVLQLDESAPSEDADPSFAALPAYSKPLLPFASGFVTALHAFPDGLLSYVDEEAVHAMDRIARHLPCSDDEEREAMAELDRERPLRTVDEAVEDLVLAVVELDALTEPDRYRVQTIQRDTPKVGRNDPCPCGSGKKYKACHGKTA
ncbi:MAG: UPF0149 family protein [Burkholderiales bacterium]|nr:UPF0149 family protein [Burkholderiales bacterium]